MNHSIPGVHLQLLASCTCCGCLVAITQPFMGYDVYQITDPAFAYQRLARSEIGACTWVMWGQRFGLGYGMPHECPPGEYPPRRFPHPGEPGYVPR